MKKIISLITVFIFLFSCSENNEADINVNQNKKNEAPDKVVKSFINNLGSKNFEKAYSLTKVKTWGDYEWFSSTKSFGGINSTTIKEIELRPDEKDMAVVYVEAFYGDPINGDSEFKQLFYLQKFAGDWKIVKLKQLDNSKKTSTVNVSYSFKEIEVLDNIIIAKLNGKTYQVKPQKSELCYPFKVTKKDFNKNGYEDLLLSNADACGGNALPTSTLYFCSYNKASDSFTLSKGFGSITEDPIVKKFNGEWIVTFYSGILDKRTKETYILKGNNAVRTKYKEIKEVETMFELKAGCNGKQISFDIDGDGFEDKITCKDYLGMKTESFEFSIQLTKTNSSFNLAGYRIGIMYSKTNGVYDLVTSFDNVFKWNGYKYILK